MLVDCIFFFPCRASVCLKQASRQAFSFEFFFRTTLNAQRVRDWQSVHTFVVPDRPERLVKFFFLSRGALSYLLVGVRRILFRGLGAWHA